MTSFCFTLLTYFACRLNKNASGAPRQPNEPWSGEATRNQGFAVEEARVDVTIGDSDVTEVVKQKDRPVWMTESTVISSETNNLDTTESILQKAAQSSTHQMPASSTSSRNKKENEDIMSVLLQHEKNNKGNHHNTAANALEKNFTGAGNSSESSDDERDIENAEIRKFLRMLKL